MKKNRLLIFSLLPFAALIFSACAGNAPQTRHYTLVASHGQRAKTTYPYRLVIKKFTVDPAYGSTNIVYRESDYEFMAYNHDLWASSPEHQVELAVSGVFKSSGLFERVENRATELPNWELLGHVLSIEEIDKDSSDRYAHLAMELTFRNVKDSKVLWSGSYDDRQKLGGPDPREIAKSMSVLVSRFSEDALRNIENVLRKQAKGAPADRATEPQDSL